MRQEDPASDERRGRFQVASLLDRGELLLNTAVALALAAGGILLVGAVLYGFARGLGREPILTQMLQLLSGLLLVFIFTELISTIRVVIARHTVEVEPFLIVGIVAAIRRLLVLSAEAEDLLGTPHFRDVVLEIAVLAATVLVLGVTVLLFRMARRGDRGPPPAA